MKYEKKVMLKSGGECILKNAREEDASDILKHLVITSGETNFLSRYPEEVRLTQEQERKFLKQVEESDNAVMIAAFVNGELTGNAGISPVAPYERCRHRAELGIAVKKQYWELGIGGLLLAASLETAKKAGYEQVELEVVETNIKAVSLYQKFGFQVIGKREHALRYRDGSYLGEYLMQADI